MEIIELPLKALKPYKRNPRRNDKAVEYVANSIRQFGFKVPIVIDENYEIVCGHTRWKAAKVIGLDTVPCIMADDLNEDQIRAFRLADNKTAEMADWDFDLLEMEFNDIDPELFDMSDFGFFQDDEQEDKAPTEVTEDDFDESTVTESVCKRGQIWVLGCHRLMCGDSTDAEDVEHLMNGEKADMVFTDPPYGMKKESEGVLNDNLNYDDLLDFNRQWIPLTFGALKDNGSWYCWGIDEPLMDIYSNILKPIALCSRAIKSSSREGEIVLDVFGGSGSTLIACEQLNRKCYICELDPHYCDVIIRRWEDFTGQKAELLEE